MATQYSFVPNADDKLLNWSLSFKTQIVATPVAFGLVAAQATAYAALHDAYAAALTAATMETTRTKSTISTKDVAKKALRIQARSLGGMIQKNLTVTDAQKLGLGITVRAVPQPIPVPSSQPLIEVVSVMGRTVSLRFKSTETLGKRGKPAGVLGLQIYSFVGDAAPEDPTAWKFEGTTAKTAMDVQFADGVAAGSQVWFVASWLNPRLMTGPGSNPVTTYLQFGNTVVALPQQARKRRAA